MKILYTANQKTSICTIHAVFPAKKDKTGLKPLAFVYLSRKNLHMYKQPQILPCVSLRNWIYWIQFRNQYFLNEVPHEIFQFKGRPL